MLHCPLQRSYLNFTLTTKRSVFDDMIYRYIVLIEFISLTLFAPNIMRLSSRTVFAGYYV